jgi:DNA mismatch repair protein MutS
MLHQLEEGEVAGKADRMLDDLPLFAVAMKKAEATPTPKNDKLGEALGAINPDEMTPKEALEALYRLKGLAQT